MDIGTISTMANISWKKFKVTPIIEQAVIKALFHQTN